MTLPRLPSLSSLMQINFPQKDVFGSLDQNRGGKMSCCLLTILENPQLCNVVGSIVRRKKYGEWNLRGGLCCLLSGVFLHMQDGRCLKM